MHSKSWKAKEESKSAKRKICRCSHMFNCSKEVSRVGFKVCRLTSVFHFILVESWFSDFYFIGMKNPKLCHLMELANQKTDFPFLPSRVVFYAWKKAYVSLRLHRKCALQCKQGNRDASFPWQPWDNLRTSIMDTLSEKKWEQLLGTVKENSVKFRSCHFTVLKESDCQIW